MPRENTVQIIIAGKDETKGAIASAKGGLSGLKSALGGIGKVAMVGFGAVAAGAAAAAGGILKLASDAAAIEPIERDFARLSESIGETGKSILTSLREASYGMVSNADLMQAANRLISMGLAESSEEAGELTRMAVRLGEAMGKGPTEAMEEFALMMANQSIPRLDTFGISAGKVRERIKELMGETAKGGITQGQLNTAIGKSTQKIEDLQQKLYLATLRQSEYTDKTKESTKVAGQMRIEKLNAQLAEEQQKLSGLHNTTVSLTGAVKGLTREEAFAQAVRELGAESLERIGEGGKGAAASMARLQATFANVKDTVGKAFVPVLAALLEPLGRLAEKYGPLVIEWAEQLAGWLEMKAIPAVMSFGKTVFVWLGQNVPIAMAAISNFWQSTLQPALGALSQYWTSTLQPALAVAVGWLRDNVPIAMAAISDFWIGTLQPALGSLAAYWTTTLQPALSTAVAWLRDNIPVAMAAISDFWTTTLQPALSSLSQYWTETLQPALSRAATWLGENIPIAMEAISSFWNETLRPAVEEVATWLGENVPIAMQAISDFWTDTLQPALSEAATWLGENLPVAMEAISTFWEETLRPTVQAIVTWLGENIPVAMEAISTFWTETLQPALYAFWDFLQTSVKPAVEAVSRVVEELVRIAFEALWIIFTEKILPALSDLWDWLSPKLVPALDAVRDAVETVTEKMGPFEAVLETIKGFLSTVAEKANALAEALSRIKPSEWFQPGSPAPFELALRGIADAAREASAAVGGIQMGGGRFGGMGRAGAGGGQRMIVVAPVMLDPRQYQNARGDYDWRSIGEFLTTIEKGL